MLRRTGETSCMPKFKVLWYRGDPVTWEPKQLVFWCGSGYKQERGCLSHIKFLSFAYSLYNWIPVSSVWPVFKDPYNSGLLYPSNVSLVYFNYIPAKWANFISQILIFAHAFSTTRSCLLSMLCAQILPRIEDLEQLLPFQWVFLFYDYFPLPFSLSPQWSKIYPAGPIYAFFYFYSISLTFLKVFTTFYLFSL